MDRRGFLTALVVVPIVAGLAPMVAHEGRYIEIVHQFGPDGVGYGPDGPVSGLEAMIGPQNTLNGLRGRTWDVYADWADV